LIIKNENIIIIIIVTTSNWTYPLICPLPIVTLLLNLLHATEHWFDNQLLIKRIYTW